mmetsp:Transcript_1772/g.6292  ORF Transcript_1772/g.6292 Transcript_1772/m.6292 type:complete len:212 (-) Transcript_1772:95-730(-)
MRQASLQERSALVEESDLEEATGSAKGFGLEELLDPVEAFAPELGSAVVDTAPEEEPDLAVDTAPVVASGLVVDTAPEVEPDLVVDTAPVVASGLAVDTVLEVEPDLVEVQCMLPCLDPLFLCRPLEEPLLVEQTLPVQLGKRRSEQFQSIQRHHRQHSVHLHLLRRPKMQEQDPEVLHHSLRMVHLKYHMGIQHIHSECSGIHILSSIVD